MEPCHDKKDDSNNKKKAKAPILEAVYLSTGQPGVVVMTNFTTQEIDILWEGLKDHTARHWNIGCGHKSTTKPKDTFS